ncbi:epidermal growth factor receptor kinase substrate 8-like protein 3 isoform X2 [Antechinus flavipes]|uniref:epidermal growth factor receptor kinase substrate 8-like protein 3 isoform X2 n=1 Tax=Antechinus flavipes TaxID=38775 RepID=UPI0022364FE5|nr:epidermal growth factor receptor kinase substrate 8-like protein 3 isoform X2 [Antechinus flavipes]XP_051849066.1 epidermal growth factor receptor kinase substrate 8-like protein 3 isoform X2 [Antechinus flavipes]
MSNEKTFWSQNPASSRTTEDSFYLNMYRKSQIPCQRDNQYPSREMEILIHVKNDIIIFVKNVMEKVMNGGEKSQVHLPLSQYIDYFQKIKYAFNLLGKTSHFLEESIVRELVCSFFQSLEYVIYYCPDSITLPKQINSPLLTDNAINLLKMNLKSNQIMYWRELGNAWTESRNSWPSAFRPPPPAYIPTFYDGWKLPEIEPVKASTQTPGASKF